MKRPIINMLCSVAVFLTCCTSQEPSLAPQVEEAPEKKESQCMIRTIDEAASIALQSLSLINQQEGSRAGYSRTFDKNTVKIATRESKSRSGEKDTLLYVFNFDDEQGFAIVAANKSVNGLIAVTEKGSYDPDVVPENPGLADYMQRVYSTLEGDISDTISFVGPSGIPDFNKDLIEYRIGSDTTEYANIKPNFNLKWGQKFPEGMLCDNGYCGCANLALAMAMTYLKPSGFSLNITYDGSNDILTFNKNEILRHKQSFEEEDDEESLNKLNLDGCSPLFGHLHGKISRLMREIGERTKSDYSSPYGTGTGIYDFIDSISSFGLTTPGMISEMFSPESYIENGGIVVIWGIVNSQVAHAWIVDGCYRASIQYGEWIREYGKVWELINDAGKKDLRLIHMNWGLNGKGNGYYDAWYYNVFKLHQLDPGVEKVDLRFIRVILIPIFNN